MKKYTTADISSELGISERTARRWIADLIEVSKGKYIVSEDVFLLLKNRGKTEVDGQPADNLRTDNGQPTDIEENEDYDFYEAFTTAEYVEFQKRINEHPVLREYVENLKEQIEFLRFSSSQQAETIKELSHGIKQRNFIEAKEKGFDKEL